MFRCITLIKFFSKKLNILKLCFIRKENSAIIKHCLSSICFIITEGSVLGSTNSIIRTLHFSGATQVEVTINSGVLKIRPVYLQKQCRKDMCIEKISGSVEKIFENPSSFDLYFQEAVKIVCTTTFDRVFSYRILIGLRQLISKNF